jgi:hypothetical protein
VRVFFIYKNGDRYGNIREKHKNGYICGTVSDEVGGHSNDTFALKKGKAV